MILGRSGLLSLLLRQLRSAVINNGNNEGLTSEWISAERFVAEWQVATAYFPLSYNYILISLCLLNADHVNTLVMVFPVDLPSSRSFLRRLYCSIFICERLKDIFLRVRFTWSCENTRRIVSSTRMHTIIHRCCCPCYSARSFNHTAATTDFVFRRLRATSTRICWHLRHFHCLITIFVSSKCAFYSVWCSFDV